MDPMSWYSGWLTARQSRSRDSPGAIVLGYLIVFGLAVLLMWLVGHFRV